MTSTDQITELLAQGLSGDAVASKLGVSRGSVAAVKANLTRGTYGASRSESTRQPRVTGPVGIFLRHEGELMPLMQRPYETEDVLQVLLAEHPDLLAGGEVGDTVMPPR